jgi:hypothetical protein
MILYQLPNGKTVFLTVEEYLSLSHEDIQYLMSVNAGGQINSPFFCSSINKKEKLEEEDEYDSSDDNIFLSTDSDDIGKIDLNNLPEEGPDFTDF